MTKYLSDKDIENFFKDHNKDQTMIVCANCQKEFTFEAPGTSNRNHCPYCLYSLHVDKEVGDRKSECGGLMEPIGKFMRPNGEEVIIHKCIECAKISNNRVAGDDDLILVAELIINQKD